MPRPYRHWTTQDRRLILEHLETHSNHELAEMIGTTHHGINRFCQKNGIRRSKEYIKKMNIDNLRKYEPNQKNQKLPPLEAK